MQRILIFFILSYILTEASGCAPSGIDVVSETDEKQYQLGQITRAGAHETLMLFKGYRRAGRGNRIRRRVTFTCVL